MLVALLWDCPLVFQTLVTSKNFVKDNWHCMFQRYKHRGLDVLIVLSDYVTSLP